MQYRNFLNDMGHVVEAGDRKISKDEFSENFIRGLYYPDQVIEVFMIDAPEFKKFKLEIYNILFNRLKEETEVKKRKDREIYNALYMLANVLYHMRQKPVPMPSWVMSGLRYLEPALASMEGNLQKIFLKDVISAFIDEEMKKAELVRNFRRDRYNPEKIKEIFQNGRKGIYYPIDSLYTTMIGKGSGYRYRYLGGAGGGDDDGKFCEDAGWIRFLDHRNYIRPKIYNIMFNTAIEKTGDVVNLRMPITKKIRDALDVLVFATHEAWKEAIIEEQSIDQSVKKGLEPGKENLPDILEKAKWLKEARAKKENAQKNLNGFGVYLNFAEQELRTKEKLTGSTKDAKKAGFSHARIRTKENLGAYSKIAGITGKRYR